VAGMVVAAFAINEARETFLEARTISADQRS
jgi:hypothetical protein